ncbi:MAG: DUF2063 domain-containing protein [Cupriavidus sp.]|nr:MAG: DUF2063 domain-containing protein [Cupriavidus sp.]
MSLLSLQRDFIGYLLDQPSEIPVSVGGDAGPGLAVYHNAYSSQLVDCLKDSYERLWAWLGDERFEQAARHHIALHPPHSWTLGDYGEGFADTIDTLYPDDPEVGEIAMLDWALRRAFDGVDAEAFDPQGLADLDWEEALIAFVPTLDLLPVKTNCGAIWNAISAGEDVPSAEMLPAPGWLRVWRLGLQPHFATIEAAEFGAIQLASSGLSFARLCDRLAEEVGVESAVESAGRYLATWLQDGVIAEIG